MNEIISLTTRNLKIFLRDKTAVFFSFLSVIILLAIYVLFLGNLMRVDEVGLTLTNAQSDFMVYSQMMPGLLVINTLTISLGNLGNIISDLEYKFIDGFLVTPVKRFKVIVAYYLSSLIITIVISSFLVALAYAVLGFTTGIYYRIDIILQVLGLIVLFSFISSAFMVFLTSFIKSINAFGAVAGVFGTIIGFMAGIYMPLAVLPETIRYISSLLPFTHMTIALKQLMLQQSFELITEEFGAETTAAISHAYGTNDIGIFGLDVPMFWIIVISMVIAFGLLVASNYLLNKRIKS